jgi:hypothetical protein
MMDQGLIGTTAPKTFCDILQIFKVVPGLIFCSDSKYVIHFFVWLKLSPQFEKPSPNELRKHFGTRTIQYEVCVLQYWVRRFYRVPGMEILLG